jgi:hypothetical protein
MAIIEKILITLLIGYATGKKSRSRTRTKGDIVAPNLKPYREFKA